MTTNPIQPEDVRASTPALSPLTWRKGKGKIHLAILVEVALQLFYPVETICGRNTERDKPTPWDRGYPDGHTLVEPTRAAASGEDSEYCSQCAVGWFNALPATTSLDEMETRHHRLEALSALERSIKARDRQRLEWIESVKAMVAGYRNVAERIEGCLHGIESMSERAEESGKFDGEGVFEDFHGEYMLRDSQYGGGTYGTLARLSGKVLHEAKWATANRISGEDLIEAHHTYVMACVHTERSRSEAAALGLDELRRWTPPAE